MKYYIFGGNGFVGRYLANALLERDKRVVVCDLQSHIDKRINIGCEYIVVDICDRNILQPVSYTHLTLPTKLEV